VGVQTPQHSQLNLRFMRRRGKAVRGLMPPLGRAGEGLEPQEGGRRRVREASSTSSNHPTRMSKASRRGSAQEGVAPRLRSTPWGVPGLGTAASTASAGSEMLRPGASLLAAAGTPQHGLGSTAGLASRGRGSLLQAPSGQEPGYLRGGTPRCRPSRGWVHPQERGQGAGHPRGVTSSPPRPTASSLARSIAPLLPAPAATAAATEAPASAVTGRAPRAPAPGPQALNRAPAPARPKTAPPVPGPGARPPRGRLGSGNPGSLNGAPGVPGSGTHGLALPGGAQCGGTSHRRASNMSTSSGPSGPRNSTWCVRATAARSLGQSRSSRSSQSLAPIPCQFQLKRQLPNNLWPPPLSLQLQAGAPGPVSEGRAWGAQRSQLTK